MSITLLIEPSILALPGIAADEKELVRGIKMLFELASLSSSGLVKIFASAELSQGLINDDLYPVAPLISDTITRLGLDNVYAPGDVRVAINALLGNISLLEDSGFCDFVYPRRVTTSPSDIHLRHYPAVREAFHISLALIPVAIERGTLRSPCVAISLGAGFRDSDRLKFAYRLEDIQPPLGARTELAGVHNLTVISTLSHFGERFDSETHWSCADDGEDLRHSLDLEITGLWRQLHGSDPPKTQMSYRVGQHFMASLCHNEASGTSRFATAVMESCARVLVGNPKYPVGPLKRADATGKKVPIVRADGAIAMRTQVNKSHEALRLMFWVDRNRTIELANVGPKFEFQIH